MSTQTLTGAINAPDALAATQRVQQLQALVTQAAQGTSTAGFAAALAAASAGSPVTSPAGSTSPSTASAPTASLGGTALAAAGEATPNAATSVPTTTSSYLAANPATGLAATTSSPTAASSTTSGSGQYDALISQAAARYGLDPAILHGLIQQESGFDANSRSSAGAEGLTQLMPGTASSMGVSNPLDPAQSIEGGARYLSQLMTQFGGNTTDALAAYNAGPGAVSKYGGVPPYAETQDYVNKVLGYADAYRASQPSTTQASTTDTGRIT